MKCVEHRLAQGANWVLKNGIASHLIIRTLCREQGEEAHRSSCKTVFYCLSVEAYHMNEEK